MKAFLTPTQMAYDDTEEVEYRDFKLVREPEFLLWHIRTLDGNLAPIELQSRFTTQELCKRFIDRFLETTKQNDNNNS